MPDRPRRSRFTEPLGALLVPARMTRQSFLALLSSDPATARQLSHDETERREADHHHNHPKDCL